MERLLFRPRNPNNIRGPKPPRGNPDHIRPPQIQNPNIRPHRQPERRPPRPTPKPRGK